MTDPVDLVIDLTPFDGGAMLALRIGGSVVTRHTHPVSGDVVDQLPIQVEALRRWWFSGDPGRFVTDHFPPVPESMNEYCPTPLFAAANSVRQALESLERFRSQVGEEKVDEVFETRLERWLAHRIMRYADLGVVLPPLAFYSLNGEPRVEWVEHIEDPSAGFLCEAQQWRVDVDQVREAFARVLGAPPANLRRVPAEFDFVTPSDAELIGTLGEPGRLLMKAVVRHLQPGDIHRLVDAFAPTHRARRPTQVLQEHQSRLRRIGGKGWERGREVARDLMDWRQASPIDPDELATRLGIPILDVSLQARDLQGLCLANEHGAPVIFLNESSTFAFDERSRRAVVGHELYHALIDLGDASVDHVVSGAWNTSEDREKAANRFAAEILAPRERLRDLLDNARGDLSDRIQVAADDLQVGKTLILLSAAHYRLAPIPDLRETARELNLGGLIKSLQPDPY